MARITWKETKYAGEDGYVGRLRLFSISFGSRRDEPTYRLSSDLQGFSPKAWKDDAADVLKARAERILEAYVRELGAVFPDSSSEEGSR
ncbi:hypothetical protein [Nonomuraea indica]|uniref:hypothetical protein n=1 Tax=Nonomuraea indica TaxID=1581193 RepID=UPI000C7B1F9E|nr:hypothetical protein [Nonomuraea indica]